MAQTQRDMVTDIRDTTFLILVLPLDECYNMPNFPSNFVVQVFLENNS